MMDAMIVYVDSVLRCYVLFYHQRAEEFDFSDRRRTKWKEVVDVDEIDEQEHAIYDT